MRILATAILSSVLIAPAFAADEYKLDTEGGHCGANWKVTHLGASYTYGRFNKMDGTLAVDSANAANNKISVTIDAASIDSAQAKRDEHLRGPDFFNVKQFPTITFASTAWKAVDATTFEVTGDLSIKGVTKPVTAKVVKIGEGKDPWGNYRIGFETTLVVKRSEFGITYMPGGIGEDVHVTFGVEGMRALAK